MSRPSRVDEIKRAAVICFAARGFEGTRISHIAAQAGMSDAALYAHFRSVRALAEEVFLDHFLRIGAEVARIADGNGSVAERVEAFVRYAIAEYRADPEAFTFTNLRLGDFLSERPPGVRLPLDSIASLMAQGQATGEVREGKPIVLASLVFGAALRTMVTDQFGSLHGFTWEVSDDDVIVFACLDLVAGCAGVVGAKS